LPRFQLQLPFVCILLHGCCVVFTLFGKLLNLFRLSRADVCLAINLLLLILNLLLAVLALQIALAQIFLSLCKLDLDIPQTFLQFLALNFSKPEHLPVLIFRAFLAFDPKPLSSLGNNLKDKWDLAYPGVVR